MPTIKIRKQANGATRYTAIVRLRRQGTILHRESRTFAHRSAALSWAKHREVALEDPAELTRKQLSTPTLAELIRWYIETFETISRWQRSKQTHLEFLDGTRSVRPLRTPSRPPISFGMFNRVVRRVLAQQP
ncbi:MAG TPA: hypothetical protein VK624_14850 [Steroidobacteraceae bacterium]|nr:hypothetical protein [Steroidobacteraceae bacterium]